MGQYYRPVSLDTMEHLYSHNYNNGLKLMEHSYIGNNFVAAVEFLLTEGARWDKHQIVWAGDYADSEPGTESDENEDGVNIYSQLEDVKCLSNIIEGIPSDHYFIVNFDKKEYVDKRHVPGVRYKWQDPEDEPLQIHPLPLLTCEGNGRGGGDFRGNDPRNIIGSWARNRIGVRSSAPEGFKEVLFDLTEE